LSLGQMTAKSFANPDLLETAARLEAGSSH
jgi:hypothetical protein